jgi:hypothetical protein
MRLTARIVGSDWEKVSDDFGRIRPRCAAGFRTASKRTIEARASRRPAASRDFLSWPRQVAFFCTERTKCFWSTRADGAPPQRSAFGEPKGPYAEPVDPVGGRRHLHVVVRFKVTNEGKTLEAMIWGDDPDPVKHGPRGRFSTPCEAGGGHLCATQFASNGTRPSLKFRRPTPRIFDAPPAATFTHFARLGELAGGGQTARSSRRAHADCGSGGHASACPPCEAPN